MRGRMLDGSRRISPARFETGGGIVKFADDGRWSNPFAD
jgi:hypothetical protein